MFTTGEGSGCRMKGVDGASYIDFVGALGALSLGYANTHVEAEVQRQSRKGSSFSLPTTLEVQVAELLQSIIPYGERWRFCKNGRDACDAAVRIARTYTQKKWVISDGYHGCSDLFTSLTPPALGIQDQFFIRPLASTSEWRDVACVIVEAIKCDDSQAYQTYLRELRQTCREKGVVFIIDEIVTGFRVPGWTVSNWWSLDPDIICIGKGLANGYPLSAVGGKKEIMNSGEWFFSTTFGGEAVSLAAAKATIEEIHNRNLEDLMFYGKRLQAKLNELHPDIKWEGYGTRAMLNTQDPSTALFMQGMVKAGFLFGKAFFFNFSHLEANLEDMVMSAAQVVVDKIKNNQIQLEGKMPEEPFRR
jgi:glutamate-1-semialdehyde aminotransferase